MQIISKGLKFTYNKKTEFKRQALNGVDLMIEEGDFFGIREISDLEKLLCASSLVNIADVLTKIDLSDFIFGMKAEDFIKLIKT